MLAFDLHPPTTAASANGFHSAAWTEVLRGGAEVLLADPGTAAGAGAGVGAGAVAGRQPLAATRTASGPARALMLAWPSNDPADCWDARCLASYRGDTVIYIGSWNAGPLAVPGFAGACKGAAVWQRARATFL